jgi:hypothetical protein
MSKLLPSVNIRFCERSRITDIFKMEDTYVSVLIFQSFMSLVSGHAVAQLVEALRYKSEGHGVDS